MTLRASANSSSNSTSARAVGSLQAEQTFPEPRPAHVFHSLSQGSTRVLSMCRIRARRGERFTVSIPASPMPAEMSSGPLGVDRALGFFGTTR